MTQSPGIINKVKSWAFPALISIVGWFIVNTLNNIRTDLEAVKADVKLLLAQSNIDKTRIDNLERMVYNRTTAAATRSNTPRVPHKPQIAFHPEFISVKPEDLYELVNA